MTVGERLKLLREKKQKSQEQVAMENGLNRSTYSRYETGSTEMDYETLGKIADYFEVTVDFLLGRSEKKNLTEQEDRLFSLQALKESRDLIAAGRVVDIPKERIPFMLDKLDGEISKIEEILKVQK